MAALEWSLVDTVSQTVANLIRDHGGSAEIGNFSGLWGKGPRPTIPAGALLNATAKFIFSQRLNRLIPTPASGGRHLTYSSSPSSRHLSPITANGSTSPSFLVDNPDLDEDDLQYLHGEEYSDARSFERILSILVPVIFGLIVIIGLVGNSLVVIVVMRNRHFRSATNLLIGNLAIADLSFLLICVPFTGTQYALAQWPFSDTWCRFVQYMINVCAYASVYTLVSMSVIRYIVVVYPMHSMYLCTLSRTFRVIAAIWIGSFLLNGPVLFLFQKYEYEFGGQNRSACIMLDGSPKLPRIFYSLFFVATFVAPISAICILYVILLRALWDKTSASSMATFATPAQKPSISKAKATVVPPPPPRTDRRGQGQRFRQKVRQGWKKGKKKNSDFGRNQLALGTSISSVGTLESQRNKNLTVGQNVTNSSFSGELMTIRRMAGAGSTITKAEAPIGGLHLKNKKKVTKLTIIVVVVFAACWLPIHIMLLAQYFTKKEFGPGFQPTLVAANCLAYMNSCVNPILYSFLSRSFYQAFLELLCPGLAKRRRKQKMICNKNRHQRKDRHTKDLSVSDIRTLHPSVDGISVGHLTTIPSGLTLETSPNDNQHKVPLPIVSRLTKTYGKANGRNEDLASLWSGSDDLTTSTNTTSRYVTAENDEQSNLRHHPITTTKMALATSNGLNKASHNDNRLHDLNGNDKLGWIESSTIPHSFLSHSSFLPIDDESPPHHNNEIFKPKTLSSNHDSPFHLIHPRLLNNRTPARRNTSSSIFRFSLKDSQNQKLEQGRRKNSSQGSEKVVPFWEQIRHLSDTSYRPLPPPQDPNVDVLGNELIDSVFYEDDLTPNPTILPLTTEILADSHMILPQSHQTTPRNLKWHGYVESAI